jgi:hypothetical protein
MILHASIPKFQSPKMMVLGCRHSILQRSASEKIAIVFGEEVGVSYSI